MAASAKSEMDEKIDQFCSITGVTRDIGQNMLEACAGNLEMAVNMQMEGDGSRRVSSSPVGAGPSHADDLINLSDDDDIRAPIPQTQETLVDDGRMYGFRGRKRNTRGVFDGFRDFQAETRYQESLRKSPRVGSLKKRTLEDLFRPPLELINRGTFAMAREKGTLEKQWLLVNVQNVKEFACQALNRDVWSNQTVRTIIKEHFVFWQVYDDSEEGRKYMQFYKVATWPYIAVIDPRTGENMVVWNKVDAITFCDLVTEFLSLHPSLDGSSPSSPSAKKQRLDDSIVNATEDEQMKAAIQASLSAETLANTQSAVVMINSDSETSELETFTDSDDSLDARVEEVVPSQKLSAKSKLSSLNTRCRSPSNKSTKNIPQKCESGKNSTLNLSDSIRKEAISNSCKRANSKTISPPSKGKDKCVKNSDKSKTKLDKSSKKSPIKTGRTSVTNSDVGSGDEHVDDTLNDSGSSISSEEKNESLTHESESPKWRKYLGKSTGVDTQTDRCDRNTLFPLMSEDKYIERLSKLTAPFRTLLDAESCLMIRYPDGEHERFKLPCSSQLMALVQYVIDKGYSNECYELVTNFPRRLISDLDFESTLKETGLYPQETVFVQAR